VKRGHNVWNLDRRQAHKPVEEAKFIYCDLRARDQVQRALQEVDAVCHLGEIPGPDSFGPDELFATNTTIGSVVMQTAADIKLKHAVYTSSVQVYGVFGWPQVAPQLMPMDESHPLQPQNTYALSKVANEAYARLMADRYGLSVSIFRPPATWGEQWSDRRLDWLEMQEGPPHEFHAYCAASDIAVAYAEAVERSLPGCHTFHFSADDIASARPLSEALAQHMPEWPKLPADWPALKSPIVTDRAKELLNWTPKYSILEEFRKIRGREPLWRARPDSLAPDVRIVQRADIKQGMKPCNDLAI
jgi:nucleoside-diphosphate-sugar epimerase